jgi:acyl-CoA dehydrogenase family member 9
MSGESRRLDLEGSIAKALFTGNVLEENLFPPHTASAPAERFLASLRELAHAKREDFRYFDKAGEFSSAYLSSLRELGVFGFDIPLDSRPRALPISTYLALIAELNRFDGATAHLVIAHSALCVRSILLFGSSEQRKRYLPRLASGEFIGAFCLNEQGAGSDASAIRTAAVRNADGSWVLNGEKTWVTNGSLAGLFTVFARTESIQGKISAFLVERASAGVTVGPREEKLGVCAAPSTTLSLRDVIVGPDALLGGEGNGFRTAMSVFDYGRLALAAGCIGAMKECIALATAHAAERRQFGRSLAEFDLVREKLGLMATHCFAAESALVLIGRLVDAGVRDFSLEAAMVKVFASEALWFSADQALQIAGAAGCLRLLPYERALRNARVNSIFLGTNEALRLYIGLSGVKSVEEHHGGLNTGVSGILNEPIKSLGLFSAYVSHQVSQLTALGRDRISFHHPSLKEHAGVFEQYTSRLHQAADTVLRKIGQGVVDDQFHLRRLADVATDLLVGLSLLAHVSTRIEKSSPEACVHEAEIVEIFSRLAKRRMNYNLRRMITNEDEATRSLADSVTEHRGYRWNLFLEE